MNRAQRRPEPGDFPAERRSKRPSRLPQAYVTDGSGFDPGLELGITQACTNFPLKRLAARAGILNAGDSHMCHTLSAR